MGSITKIPRIWLKRFDRLGPVSSKLEDAAPATMEDWDALLVGDAPPAPPFERACASEPSGGSVAGWLGTADGCGDNENIEVQISARSGRIGSVGNFVGVVVDRVGSALRLRGPRKAVQGVLDSSLPSVATP